VTNPDLAIYAAHLVFWGAFGVARALLARQRAGTAAPAPVAREERVAPHSRMLLMLHMAAFGIMYFGIGNAVFPRRVPDWFAGQRLVGAAIIAIGMMIAVSTLFVFRSWRYRAKLDAGHQLATNGPFRYMRHPIYMGLNLLAVGSAIWVPTPTLGIAALLMIVGSDLRGRAEEKLLLEGFGATYRDYCNRTRRFIPGIY
jgi:protein-S-isoprenylcysteine O-methyltransferase Ste14